MNVLREQEALLLRERDPDVRVWLAPTIFLTISTNMIMTNCSKLHLLLGSVELSSNGGCIYVDAPTREPQRQGKISNLTNPEAGTKKRPKLHVTWQRLLTEKPKKRQTYAEVNQELGWQQNRETYLN